MKDLRYTLVSDGSADVALLPILNWLLITNGVKLAIQPSWADLRQLRRSPATLLERITLAIDLYPCELLFIHRDAENQDRQIRLREIQNALTHIGTQARLVVPPFVCVIPVRMTEAWLLIDEPAIKRAAGNASSTQHLGLPSIDHLELLPDPKNTLHSLLRLASGLHGRRLDGFRVGFHAQRVAGFVSDFSALEGLEAFECLRTELRQVVRDRGWDVVP